MITREQAIASARARVLADGVMSLEGRDTTAALEDETWHVSFPFLDAAVRGGEPHVYIDAESGVVSRIVYTQ